MDVCINCNQQFGVFTSIDLPNDLNQIEGSPTIVEALSTVKIKTFKNKIVFPFILKCSESHRICHSCIIKNDKIVKCPRCNSKSNLSEVKLDSATFLLNRKQNNNSILQVESSVNDLLTQHQSVENKKLIKETISRFISRCCHCKTKGNYADIYCGTCETIFCRSCLQKHPGHMILPLGKVDFEKLSCHYHKNDKAEMFCAKEKRFICTKCLGPDGHIRHKYFSFYDSKIIESKLMEIELSCKKLKIKNIQEQAQLNETIKFVSKNDKCDDVQKTSEISKKMYELLQSNSIIDAVLSEIQQMLASSDYKIIYVASEEKNLELESLLMSYYIKASSIVQPNNLEDLSNISFDLETPDLKKICEDHFQEKVMKNFHEDKSIIRANFLQTNKKFRSSNRPDLLKVCQDKFKEVILKTERKEIKIGKETSVLGREFCFKKMKRLQITTLKDENLEKADIKSFEHELETKDKIIKKKDDEINKLNQSIENYKQIQDKENVKRMQNFCQDILDFHENEATCSKVPQSKIESSVCLSENYPNERVNTSTKETIDKALKIAESSSLAFRKIVTIVLPDVFLWAQNCRKSMVEKYPERIMACFEFVQKKFPNFTFNTARSTLTKISSNKRTKLKRLGYSIISKYDTKNQSSTYEIFKINSNNSKEPEKVVTNEEKKSSANSDDIDGTFINKRQLK